MNREAPVRFRRASAAKEHLLEAMLSGSDAAGACVNLLDILIKEGSLNDASRIYSLFSKRDRCDLEAGRMLARACAEAGDVRQALTIYRALVRRFPREYVNYKDMEKLYLRIGRADRAVALYKSIGRTHPLRRKSYKRLTAIYSRLGDTRRAIFYLRKEMKEYGASAKLYRELGKLHMASGHYVKAIQSFQNALACQKEDQGARTWLGLALMENGNYRLAEYEFVELLKERPHGFQELIHMAELRIRENRLDDAREYLRQIERLYPDNSRVKLCRAEIAFLEGRHREAAELGETALRQTPFYFTWEQMRCHRILKHVYLALKQREKAKLHREMQEALKSARDVFSGLIRVAELKIRNGKTDEGREILDVLLELYPGNARARLALAELMLLEKRSREAIDIAESVLQKSSPQFALERSRAHGVLARAYGKTGERKKAALHRRERDSIAI